VRSYKITNTSFSGDTTKCKLRHTFKVEAYSLVSQYSGPPEDHIL